MRVVMATDQDKVQTRINGDIRPRLESYREDHDLSEYDAVRQLIEAGLARKGYDSREERSLLGRVLYEGAKVLLAFAAALAVLELTPTGAVISQGRALTLAVGVTLLATLALAGGAYVESGRIGGES
jgi:hypothetical protein